MKRRELLKTAGLALTGLAAFPFSTLAAEAKKPKVLFFTRSAGFPHPVVVRKKDTPLAFAEKQLVEIGHKAGIDVECCQDASVFDSDLAPYDALAFYTSGNPLSPAQKKNLLSAIEGGKGFVGFHSATDTFRTASATQIDPFTAMLGAEFVTHGAQQVAPMRITSANFPGVKELDETEACSLNEEWYAMRKFAKDLHVILLLDTSKMKGDAYQRPPFPITWARKQGKGRVYYTALGHREDVWTNPKVQGLITGGLNWVLGKVDFDPVPNIDTIAPKANQLKQ